MLVNFDPAIDLTALAEFRAALSIERHGPSLWSLQRAPGKCRRNADSLSARRAATAAASGRGIRALPFRWNDIDYVDAAPWPAALGGTGSSLQRVVPMSFGNDPGN